MINFCNVGLVSNINSDKVCSDGHDVKNLISLNPVTRRKGFMVASFVIPPVFIDLTFICNIDIDHIIVKRNIDSQKTSHLLIYTERHERNKVLVINSELINDTTEFHIFGRKENAIAFTNSIYLNKIKKIYLKICKTESSSLSVLGGLSIWGRPSRHNKKLLIEKVTLIWNKINVSTTSDKPIKPKAEDTKNTEKNQIRDIDEEFLDPITNHIMSLPMTLPSGKTVDMSTINRYCDEQARYGRPRSDPFTGVPFTSNSKPVVASQLKSRLDLFLLKNSHVEELKNVPRTAGTLQKEDTSYYMPGPSSSNRKNPKKDLDELMDAYLDGLPSFLHKETKKVKNDCSCCSKTENLFKLPCDHLICRHCLCKLKVKKQDKCGICSKIFKYSDISRFHFNTLET